MKTQPYYIHKLKECLSLKQKNNPSYSLRAFSRDLDIHCATLSQVFKGNRGLPFKRANDIVEKLELSPKETTLFMESFFKSKTSLDKIKVENLDQRFMLDENYYKVIGEWEHYAVLELFELAHFNFDPKTVAKKLGLTLSRSEVVITNLLDSGLLIKNIDGEFDRAHAHLSTTEDIASKALKKSHKETLNLGIQKLENTEVALRDYSSTTVAMDMDKLPEAKTIIREFRQKMAALLRDGHKTEVYQLAIQFFPLTEIQKQEQ